jgi:putative DNA primase/helicase
MSQQKLPWFNLTDQGNALGFAHLYSDKLKYCPEKKGWLGWTGSIWESQGDAMAWQAFIKSLEIRLKAFKEGTDTEEWQRSALGFLSKAENHSRSAAGLAMATKLPQFMVKMNQFDSDPWLLTCENGEIDLKTGIFRPARVESYSTCQIPVRFNPNEGCPQWVKALDTIFLGDQAMIDYFQRCVGYSLTGNTREQVMFVCVGEGANGKSTILEVIKTLLGTYASSTPFTTFDAKTRNEQTNDLARLKGKRLVTIVETDEDSWLAEAKVKLATGGEAITCRFLQKEFFEYIPQFKIWMATNRAPQIKGTDHGIRRRLLLIPFNKRFEGSERVDGFKDILLAELPGILNWALKGLAEWQKRGLKLGVPQVIEQTTDEYKADNDTLDQWIDECVVRGNAEIDLIRATDLYDSYSAFMKRSNLRPKGLPQWGKDMKSKGIEKRRADKGTVYCGVKVVEAYVH